MSFAAWDSIVTVLGLVSTVTSSGLVGASVNVLAISQWALYGNETRTAWNEFCCLGQHSDCFGSCDYSD